METYSIDVIRKIVQIAIHIDREMRFENVMQLDENKLVDLAIKSSASVSSMKNDPYERRIVELFKQCAIDGKVFHDKEHNKLVVGLGSIRHDVAWKHAVCFVNEFYAQHSKELKKFKV